MHINAMDIWKEGRQALEFLWSPYFIAGTETAVHDCRRVTGGIQADRNLAPRTVWNVNTLDDNEKQRGRKGKERERGSRDVPSLHLKDEMISPNNWERGGMTASVGLRTKPPTVPTGTYRACLIRQRIKQLENPGFIARSTFQVKK